MTVYVDDSRRRARVGGITGRWSHLITDNPDINELHEFADRIGLRREWFQEFTKRPAGLYRPHYDVTDSKRQEAIAAGATPIGVRDMSAVLARARGENPTSPEGNQ